MATLGGLAHTLGPLLLDPDAVDGTIEVRDVALPGPGGTIAAGELVLAVWVLRDTEAAAVLRAAGRAGAAGVVVDRTLDEDLRRIARRERVGLAGKSAMASWADVFRAAQIAAVAEHAEADLESLPALPDLADRLAGVLGGPVTVEDDDSRVLAHSLDQTGADEPRSVSILHRAVPGDRVDHYQLLGLYDALATGADQVLAPAGDTTRTRVVLPIRADDADARDGSGARSLVGTVWVLRDDPLTESELAAARPVLATIALRFGDTGPLTGHGIAATARGVRSMIHHAPSSSPVPLRDPPWVVGVISSGGRSDQAQLTLWHELLRRRGWHQPVLTTIDAGVVCVLGEHGSGPGTLSWWLSQVEEATADPASTVTVGSRAMSITELRRSHDDAEELVRLGRMWPELVGTVLRHEQCWAELTVLRLLDRRSPTPDWAAGPLPDLLQLSDFLVETLWHYLAEDASIPRTASILQVHPNTLRYRLGRLRRAGADLDRPVVRQALRLQLLMLRYEGRLDIS